MNINSIFNLIYIEYFIIMIFSLSKWKMVVDQIYRKTRVEKSR